MPGMQKRTLEQQKQGRSRLPSRHSTTVFLPWKAREWKDALAVFFPDIKRAREKKEKFLGFHRKKRNIPAKLQFEFTIKIYPKI